MWDDDYSFENLKKMTYIDCVEKEVTRFYGPVNGSFLRKAVRDHFIRGIPIKKSTILMPQPMGLHYSEKYYKNAT